MLFSHLERRHGSLDLVWHVTGALNMSRVLRITLVALLT